MGPRVCWVMLNPSTADAHHVDATLRRCLAFARSWGAGSIEVVNLFALVSSDQKQLLAADDPIGRQNVAAVRRAMTRADSVVVAWGRLSPRLVALAAPAIGRLPARVVSVGLTAEGYPRHPLYVRGTTPRMPFRLAR